MLSAAHLDFENTIQKTEDKNIMTVADLYKKDILNLYDPHDDKQNMFRFNQLKMAKTQSENNNQPKKIHNANQNQPKRLNCKTPFKILDAPNL